MTTTICNARITSCWLGFFSPDLADGKDFKLKMELKLSTKGECIVELNPIKIPMLLELLGLRGFNEIECKYIQVKYEVNKRPDFIKDILASESDEWFELDNGIYLGSRITEGVPNEE